MNHLNEDQLQKFVLDILDTEEKASVQSHLSGCSDCRERQQRISRDIELLGSIQTKDTIHDYALPSSEKSRMSSALLKSAALLLVGFTAGLGASTLCRSECVNVIPYQSRTVAEQVSNQHYTICETLDALSIGLLSSP